MALWLTATGLATLILAAWLRERTLYVIFLWAYVQNFILAWMYTSAWAGKDVCHALLLSMPSIAPRRAGSHPPLPRRRPRARI